jgi:hypothetical protein
VLWGGGLAHSEPLRTPVEFARGSEPSTYLELGMTTYLLLWFRAHLPFRCFLSVQFGQTKVSLKLEAATAKLPSV